MSKASQSTRTARTKAASLERREDQKRELRTRILSAAGDEFLEHGPENFSLRRVAERIGYSPTTIYIYFQNKDDLLLQTVADGFKNFDQTIESALDKGASAPAQLEALGQAYIRFGLDHPALYRLMFMQRSEAFMPRLLGSGTLPEDIEAAMQMPHHRVLAQELLVATVRQGIEDGTLRSGDPVLLADALWAGVHGLVSLSLSPLMTPEHGRKVALHLLPTLIEGLKA